MIDIKFIINNKQQVQENCKNRHVDINIEQLVEAYESVKKKRMTLDELRAQSNENAKAIKQASPDQRSTYIEKGKQLKQDIAGLEDTIKPLAASYKELLLKVPNLTQEGVPIGKDESDNEVLKTHLEPTTFDFKPKSHTELGESLDILDFKSGAKVAARKFYYLKGKGALLELALTRFAIDKAVEKGYTPIITPDLAKDEVILGSGFSPRGPESQIYSIEGSDLSLIGTSEITIGGLHAGDVFEEGDLPKKYVAFSHCFRTEAGSHGKESQGLYRVHQFSKVELYQFAKPDQSEQSLEDILALEEAIYQALEIPYQVVTVCTGDLGGPAYKKYDIEAWMPNKGEHGEYGEVTSVSNCTDFQARRLNIKYKEGQSKHYVHTLNGTALALSRVPIAILENGQTQKGSVIIPEALRPYTGFDEIV